MDNHKMGVHKMDRQIVTPGPNDDPIFATKEMIGRTVKECLEILVKLLVPGGTRPVASTDEQEKTEKTFAYLISIKDRETIVKEHLNTIEMRYRKADRYGRTRLQQMINSFDTEQEIIYEIERLDASCF